MKPRTYVAPRGPVDTTPEPLARFQPAPGATLAEIEAAVLARGDSLAVVAATIREEQWMVAGHQWGPSAAMLTELLTRANGTSKAHHVRTCITVLHRVGLIRMAQGRYIWLA